MRVLLFIVVVSIIAFPCCAAGSFPIKLGLKKSSANTLYVDAILSKAVATEFMIDTGSSVVVINQKTFQQLLDSGSDIIETTQMGARLASGRIRLVKQYRIASLSLGENCTFTNVEVAVMNKSNNILGMSLLSATAPFAIYARPAQLALSQCSGQAEELAHLTKQ